MTKRFTETDLSKFQANSASDPMCGYAKPGDDVTRDPTDCTCEGCLDWIGPLQKSDKRNDKGDMSNGTES